MTTLSRHQLKNWCLSLFLIYLSLSIRSYLPTETWVPRTMIKQNFFFLYRPMGTRKIPKSSTAYILIVMCYELSRLIVFRSKRGDLWKQGLSNTGLQTRPERAQNRPGCHACSHLGEERENFTAIGGHFHWVEIT